MEASSFTPVAWLPGRHLQTIVPAFWRAPSLCADETTRIVRVDERAAVRLHVARPTGEPRGTLLLVHGVSGSFASSYMKRTAATATGAGWVAVRMNCRNCGGTEDLSRTLYNAGQSEDIGRVLEDLEAAGYPRPFAAVGFSLGGGMVLRYAGTTGAACLADVVAAVNPPIDLEACCRSLEEPRNVAYHTHFTWSLCRQLQRIRRIRPLEGPPPALRRIRTLRRLDTLYTAPDAGYGTAEDYYAGASAAPHLGSIRARTLVIASENDPFVPVAMFSAHRRSGAVSLLVPARGGHLGYWQAGERRFWAGEAVVAFLAA